MLLDDPLSGVRRVLKELNLPNVSEVKIQAAIAMSQRAKVASERAKDPKKKKDLGAAHKVYQSYHQTTQHDFYKPH